jgi:hypothetical protein
MNKEFIPYEQALALKELGFDEPCFYYYNSDKKLFQVYNKYKINDTFKNSQDDHNIMLSSPLYQQAFRWFKEKYNIEHNNRPAKKFEQDKSREISIYIDGVFISNLRFTLDNTYEEAELECLKKLIEIVKEK